MIYVRQNNSVCFLLPTMAVGSDLDGRFFVEVAWLNFAVGVGK